MKTTLIRLCGCVLSVLLLLSAVGCAKMERQPTEVPEKYLADGTEYDLAIKSTYDFHTVAENTRFRLDILKRTAEIRVTDKQTGREWYSNPQNRTGGAGNMSRISSQIIVQYTVNDSAYTFTSYGDAILNDQYNFSPIDNGIRVNFRVGEYHRDYVVPQVIDQARYAEIMGALTEDEQLTLGQYYELVSVKDDSMDRESRALILDKFPILAEKDCYVCQLRTSITSNSDSQFASDYLLEKMETLFLASGYTMEKLEQDNEENMVTAKMFEDTSIALSVEYTLEEDGLVACIPQDSIAFDDSLLQLTKIQLLPFFGAADTTQEGYIFVPDGSGALIHLNNGKTTMEAYEKAVYGQDWTIPARVNVAADESSEQIYLPVYGLKTADAAFLAVIEDGAAIAAVNADISGKGSNFNTVGVTFNVNSAQTPATLSLNAQYNRFYQERIAQCDYSVRYQFLYGDEANYSGMARAYRTYLTQRGLLNKTEDAAKPALFLDILQAVDHKQVVLGVPVNQPLALTTCNQTVEILQALEDAGVDSVRLQLTGWANGGVTHTAMNRVRWMNCLGGKKGYLSLVEYVGKHNGSISALCDFQNVRKLTLFDGYSPNTHSARTLENVAAYTSTGTDTDKWAVVSPAYYGKLISSFTGRFAAEAYGGLSLAYMGIDLNGDYHSGKMMDRQAAMGEITRQMQSLTEQGYELTMVKANAYAFAYASFISDVPLTSGKENLFDESVPFYQLVLSGSVPYSSEPLNQVSDYDETVLKLLETGTLPSFMWMYEENTVLKETEYAHYYSVCYRAWLDKAVALYAEVKDTLGDCVGQPIAAHSQVAVQVYRTTYENGVAIYVNYSDREATVDGVTVPAGGYRRVEGGAV